MSKELDKLFPLESFIHGSYIDPKICDALIEEHKASDEKKPGVLKNGNVDVTQKDSVDLLCSPFPEGPPFTNYMGALQIVLNEYQKKYKEVGLLEPFHVRQNWNPSGNDDRSVVGDFRHNLAGSPFELLYVPIQRI